jgi:hypothetical protein
MALALSHALEFPVEEYRMRCGLALGVAVLAAVAATGCGENLTAGPTSPTVPTTSPFAVAFAGLYSGTTTLASVSGGECVGADYSAQIASSAPDVGTVTITQERSDVRAIVRSASTGLTCRYEGNASLATFALTATSCDTETILVGCSTGQARVLELVGSTMTANTIGTTTEGVVATYYNVFSDSTETGQRKPVSGMILQHTFSARR